MDPKDASQAVRGSFSAAGIDEMVGEVPCPSPGGNMTLLRRAGADWQIARFTDVDGRRQRIGCRAARMTNGRDLLVCREVLNVGSVHGESLVAYDFAGPSSEEGHVLFAATDTTTAACSGAKEVAVVRLDDFALVDVDGDGDLDVRAALHAQRARVPPHFSCDEQGTGTGPAFAKPKGRTLEFLLEGTRFIPTGATQRLLASLETELPTP